MGISNEGVGNTFISYLNDDNVEAVCETWGKLRAMEYARQLGMRDEEYEKFVLSNYEKMVPQGGEESIKLLMRVMGIANGTEPEELGRIIFSTVEDEVTRAMPMDDAHDALTLLWNNAHFGRVEAPAIAKFLSRREDAEMLIFWNAPLRDWGMGDDSAYPVGQWVLRSGNLFSLACLMIQDDIIEAIGGFFTPNMCIKVETKQPNAVAQSMSCTVLESAIWTTVSSDPDPDAAKEADRKRRRRRIIDLLISGGASPVTVELPRAAYLPSNGDPMEAAKMAENREAFDSIMFARGGTEGDDIGRVTGHGTPKPAETRTRGKGRGKGQGI